MPFLEEEADLEQARVESFDNGAYSDDASLEDDAEAPDLRDQAADEERKTLAKNETRAVSVLRIFVLLVLFVTAILVSLAVFFYTRDVQEDEFKARFESIADSVMNSFHDAVERKLGAMDAISASLTSSALSSGDQFPFVTFPDFDVRASTARVQADAIYIMWMPLVTDDQREEWENYTVREQDHLLPEYFREEALRQQQDAEFGYGEAERRLHANHNEYHPEVHPFIFGGDGNGDPEQPGSGPYLPLWQMSPTLPLISMLNFNFFAFDKLVGMFNVLLETGTAVLTGVSVEFQDTDNFAAGDTDGKSSTEDLVNAFLSLGQYRHDLETYRYDPLTPMAYPVFDNFSVNRTVVGALYTSLYWRLLLTHGLSADVKGVVCVLTNNVGQEFSFRISGEEVLYLGIGDLHDQRYNSMAVSRDVSEYVKSRASVETRSLTAVDLNSDYMNYVLTVYPSQEMEDDYVTNQPVLYTIVIGSVFIFTSMVFLLYDWLVERRQRKVMDKAVKSSAVVKSLFPEVVRDRLFGDETENAKKKKKGSEWVADDKKMSVKDYIDGDRSTHKGRAIADKFEATTVLFADVAGFTGWSATREPDQVFKLLETLYGTFDKLAAKRGVFKVETIGDCYLAVTGLPNPQKEHAIIMARFARDCMTKMKQITQELRDELGEDTLKLTLRVGLHSGEVTAGVLRGDKSRFQLFGDTVNTASRMESNGMPGRIHCSQSTADAISSMGRGHWLSLREDKVVAKGKGEMQTYWVNVSSSEATSSGDRSSNGNLEPVADGFRPARRKSSLSLGVPAVASTSDEDSNDLKTAGSTSNSTDLDTKPDSSEELAIAPPEQAPSGFHRKLYPESLALDESTHGKDRLLFL